MPMGYLRYQQLRDVQYLEPVPLLQAPIHR